MSGAFLKELSGPPPQTGLKFLSAFLRMSGMLDAPVTGLYTLASGEEDLSGVHSLFRAAASMFGLPAERLAVEAKRAVEIIEALVEEGKSYSVLSVFPDVDAPDIQWERVGEVSVNVGLLETLVHHPVGWVSPCSSRVKRPIGRSPTCLRVRAHSHNGQWGRFALGCGVGSGTS